MAAQVSFFNVAEDELTCPVCNDIFTDQKTPKDLDCPHVCCQSCIQNIAGGRGVVTCPECRKVTRIPKGGVDAMRTNLRLKNLASKHAVHKQNREIAPPKCDRHAPELMHFYCATCNKTACPVCRVLTHTEHDIKELKGTYEEQTEKMRTTLEDTESEAQLCDKSAADLDTLERNIKRSLAEEKKKIDTQEKLAIQNVQRAAQVKRRQLREMEDHRLQTVRTDADRLRKHAQDIRAENRDVERIIEETTNHEYVTQHDDLVERLRLMIGVDKGLGIDRQPDKAKFVFGSSDPNVPLGKVVKSCRLEKVQEFGKYDALVGITETPEGYLVLLGKNGETNQLYVYYKENGQYEIQKSFALSSTKNKYKPHGVAVTAEGKLLIARVSQIEVYSPSGVHEHSVDLNKVNAHVIKVLPDGRILVADVDRRMIKVLAPGDLEQVVRVIDTSVAPRCVAILPHNHVAISNFQSPKVLVIDLEYGLEVESFNIPNALGLCYHDQTDTLLVGRSTQLLRDKSGPLFGMGVIEQYCNSTGGFVAGYRDIKLDAPWNMVLTQDGKLAVAEPWNVKVFNVV